MATSRAASQEPVQNRSSEFVRRLNISRVLIHDLPAELIDLIARDLDNPSLIACKSASPILRAAVYQEFGRRFFTVIPMAMNPLGLTALSDIGRNPGLAKHVQIIQFGLQITLTHPLHDSQIIRKEAIHSWPTTLLETNLEKLRDARIDANALRIANTIPSFPRLGELTLCCTSTRDQCRKGQNFIGGLDLDDFTCPSGHCAPSNSLYIGDDGVFACIAKVMAYVRLKEEVKLGYQSTSRYNGAIPVLQIPTASAIAQYRNFVAQGLEKRRPFAQRPWRLQLNFDTDTDVPVTGPCLRQWQESNIHVLDVVYSGSGYHRAHHSRFAREMVIGHLPLKNLRQLVLRLLWTRTKTLTRFIEKKLVVDRITQVSLIRCSVRVPGPATPRKNAHWGEIIKALQTLSNIHFLYLDHLGTNEDASARSSTLSRNKRLNGEMALKAEWKSRKEVASGLSYLARSHQVFQTNSSTRTLFLNGHLIPVQETLRPARSRYYLNMRWANLVAAPHIYFLSKQEVRGLERDRLRKLHGEIPVARFQPLRPQGLLAKSPLHQRV